MYLASDLYFQKQGAFGSQCGKCALNNLLGSHQVTRQMLDDICKKFSNEYKQDYKHMFGGDYDVNVLTDALNIFNKDCKWLNTSDLASLDNNQKRVRSRLGFLINREQKPNILKTIVGLSDRHWIAVRQFYNQYYVLDSKKQEKVPEHVFEIIPFLFNEFQKGSYVIEITEKIMEKK